MSQDPQPLDRRSSDGTLRAGKRLPLDRRALGQTLRARVRRGRVRCAAPGAWSLRVRSIVPQPEACHDRRLATTGG